MISPNENIEPIVPMGLLAEVLSCDIRWKDGSLQVLHPNRGELPVSSSERCPQVPRRLALELIREMEDAKVGVPQFAEGFEAEVSWMRSLLESHPVLSGLPSWIKKRLIVQPGEWSDLPVNRRLRKTMRREGFAVHLFAGEESGFTLSRALQQLGARDGWLLELDVLRGESHDLLKDRGCYSGLLRSALEAEGDCGWAKLQDKEHPATPTYQRTPRCAEANQGVGRRRIWERGHHRGRGKDFGRRRCTSLENGVFVHGSSLCRQGEGDGPAGALQFGATSIAEGVQPRGCELLGHNGMEGAQERVRVL